MITYEYILDGVFSGVHYMLLGYGAYYLWARHLYPKICDQYKDFVERNDLSEQAYAQLQDEYKKFHELYIAEQHKYAVLQKNIMVWAQHMEQEAKRKKDFFALQEKNIEQKRKLQHEYSCKRAYAYDVQNAVIQEVTTQARALVQEKNVAAHILQKSIELLKR